MSDFEEIRRVVVRSAHLLDDKRFDEWRELFTEDARYTVHAMDLSGRDTIVDTLTPLMAPAMTKHLLGYPVVELLGDDEAEAFTDMTTFVGPKGSIAPVTIGRYHDRLRRTPDGWKLASRTLIEVGGD